MANPLTGDFEAVLQVSGTTVNRLLASIHQNDGVNRKLPGFPHGTWIRVGDPDPIDGMRGNIRFQASVPRIDLIHGVSDRFWLEVSIRAQYTRDPGTVPLPEFIHGTVRAQYRIETIDPNCYGWHKLASEYLWIRVVGDTVSFTGTAENDADDLSLSTVLVDAATADARITQLARVLLTTRFEATPHSVSSRFRGGSMRSLHAGSNRSVIAVPLALSGDTPSGRIDSISQGVLEGRDFGFAVARDYIMSKIQQQLDNLRGALPRTFGIDHRTSVDLGPFGFDVLTVKITWTITSSATAQWLGGFVPMLGMTIPGGLISITIKGQARTEKAMFNWDFDVTQLLLLSFDAASEQFGVSAFGPATVNFHGTFGAIIAPRARPEIQAKVAAGVNGAAAALGEMSLKASKGELVRQLQTIDDKANAWLDEAAFTPDGVIVRGRIALAPRRAPVHSFTRVDQPEGFSALESWIPGGRIDSFNWSWSWFNNGGSPGSDAKTDRFVLRRPPGAGRGRFGVIRGVRRPLPGLDGMGRVCLAIHGVHVHPVTGDLVPVSAVHKCKRFGLDIRLAVPGRVFVREWVPGPRDPIGPVSESAIHEIGGRNTPGHSANTLLVRIGDRWNREVATSLRDGLATSQRRDAGLVVLLLFSDGSLMRAAPELLAEFDQLIAELEAPLVVNEDVRGSWSEALGMNAEGDLEWRLISPTGGILWAHRGTLGAREVAAALDDYLLRSPAAKVPHNRPGLAPGARLSWRVFETGVAGRLAPRGNPCPPPPIGRLGIGTVVTFVTRGSASSEAALRALAQAHRDRGEESFMTVVLDAADGDEVEHVRRSLPDDILVIPDTDGMIARRFGVRVWPTSVSVNEAGLVTDFEMGHDTIPEPRTSEAS